MKKSIILILILLCSSFCTSRSDQVEKINEDGVEVIVNHSRPYRIKGEPSFLKLDEIFAIDSEKKNLTSLGLTDIWGFDVDSEGNILVFKPPTAQGDLVYKFSSYGSFIRSFAPRGEGPGEVSMATFQKINSRDEIWITDAAHSKIMVFDKDGSHIDEIPLGLWIGTLGNMFQCLPNGNYLIRRSVPRPAGNGMLLTLSLYDCGFREITQLDQFKIDQPMSVEKFRLPMKLSVWAISIDKVFIANEEQGYEIHVYDLKGNLKRKIRNEHQPVRVSDGFKYDIRQKLENSPPALKAKVFFPSHFPPFKCLFADDRGYLFVMTYERGLNPNEFNVDVFNPGGIYVATMSLNAHLNDPVFTPGGPFDSWITMKKDRLYAIREKSSAFKELVVYDVQRE